MRDQTRQSRLPNHAVALCALALAAACSSDTVEPGVAAPAPGGSTTLPNGTAGVPASGQAGGTAAPRAGSGPVATGGAGQGVTPGGSAGAGAAAGATAAAGGAAPSGGTTGSTAGSVAAGSGGAVAAAGSVAPAAGGAAPSGTGGFPKTDAVSITAKGPYTVMTYEDGLDEPTYDSSTMYYPVGAEPPFAAVAFTPGFTATKENYTFLGDMLASHGIIALLTTPTSTSDQPPPRGDDLAAAVKRIQAENDREGSPLKGKIATDRICVTGHSMGGGGTLFAANELGTMIRCAVPLQPWQPAGSFPMIKAPTLFIGAQGDTIASVSGNAMPHYNSIPDSVEKILVVFTGDHYLSTNRTSTDTTAPEEATPSFDIQAAYMIPFYKLHLEDDERYRPYLYGDMRSTESVTDFQASKM